MTLKNFTAGESIKASETNSNNQFLLKQVVDYAELLDEKINSISSGIDSAIVSTLNNAFPVGAVYIGITETCPMASLFGIWEKVSEGRVLQGADETHNAGSTIEPAIPNITGRMGNTDSSSSSSTGCFYRSGKSGKMENTNGDTDPNVYFDASRSSSVYKKDCKTVQPPAFVVNIWMRVA